MLINQVREFVDTREELQIFIHVYVVVTERYNMFFEQTYERKRQTEEEDIPCLLRSIGYHFAEGDLRANQVLPVIQFIWNNILVKGHNKLGWTPQQMLHADYWYQKIMKDVENSLRIG